MNRNVLMTVKRVGKGLKLATMVLVVAVAYAAYLKKGKHSYLPQKCAREI